MEENTSFLATISCGEIAQTFTEGLYVNVSKHKQAEFVISSGDFYKYPSCHCRNK